MEDILITKDKDGGTAFLTVYSPQSHYGIPVLRIEGAEDVPDNDFGPADIIGEVKGQIITGASIVAGWAMTQGRTAQEIEIARSYLRQWPDGPQLPETLSRYTCLRCGHGPWTPRGKERPRICPSCKSPYWDRPKKGA